MSYLIGLAIVIFFFIILHYFTELDNKQKVMISIIVAAVIGGAYLYNKMSDAKRQHILDIVLRYEQGKTVKCEGTEVNTTMYSYSVGTQTFIGRESTENYGRMVDASVCQ